MAEELGLDDYYAGVLPKDKAARVVELQQKGLLVGMVGDGVNDAPALGACRAITLDRANGRLSQAQ